MTNQQILDPAAAVPGAPVPGTPRARRPWDPTPGEAEATASLLQTRRQIDQVIAQMQASRAVVTELLLRVAQGQQVRAEGVPVVGTRDGVPALEPDDAAVRAMTGEIAAVSRESRRAVQADLSEAWSVEHQFPAVKTAFGAGEIDADRVSVVIAEGSRLAGDDLRAQFERLVLPHARAKTVWGTRQAAKRIAAELEPETLEARHEKARRKRGVFVRDLDDGMAELCLVSDAIAVHGAHDRVTRMARRVAAARNRDSSSDSDTDGGAGDNLSSDASSDTATGADVSDSAAVDAEGNPIIDERSFDQIRADITADLLLTGAPDAHHVADPTGRNILDAIVAKVHVTIPVATLAGLEDEPADLAGYGPVAASFARRAAAGAGAGASHWVRLFHHPDTGALLTVDRYKPTAEQRRYLVARDETCRFPHCTRTAGAADIDHTIDYAFGGDTDVGNLAHVCRHHHVLKHQSAWTPTLHPGGDVTWTSPAGLEYLTRPAPVVRFVDAEDARHIRHEHVRRGDVGHEDPAEHQGRPQSKVPAEHRGQAEPEDAQARARARRALADLRTGNKAKAKQAWSTLAASNAATADVPF